MCIQQIHIRPIKTRHKKVLNFDVCVCFFVQLRKLIEREDKRITTKKDPHDFWWVFLLPEMQN